MKVDLVEEFLVDVGWALEGVGWLDVLGDELGCFEPGMVVLASSVLVQVLADMDVDVAVALHQGTACWPNPKLWSLVSNRYKIRWYLKGLYRHSTHAYWILSCNAASTCLS